jgi:transposase
MKTNEIERPAIARRHVHLGDRLLAIGRIRSGIQSVEEVARDLGVSAGDVERWLTLHADERIVTLAELRGRRRPAYARLERRARRLTRLVEEAEREVRRLERELLSKQFGEKSPESAARVVPAQRKHAIVRAFVDATRSR